MNKAGKKEGKKRTAFVYSDRSASFDYGSGHPMKPERLRLTAELIGAMGLGKLPSSEFVEARSATAGELLLFHTPEYIEVLKEADSGVVPAGGADFGLGYSDNPVFRGVFEWSALCAGASLQAAELVAEGRADIAFNISGGLHHAMPARASGFCYLNDAAVAIKYLAGLGKRVAYVDIDAHHGDGVEAAFYSTDSVLTVSVHESGEWLFPGTGASTDIGAGRGRGFAVNLPLAPAAGDELFSSAVDEVVCPFIEAFSPDILVTQLGVDTFETDPITHLRITTNGFEKAVRRFRDMNLPWVGLGGGGYDIGNVARAWTLAWAIMNGVEAPDEIPEELMRRRPGVFRTSRLRDAPIRQVVTPEEIKAFDENVDYLKKTVLPLVRRLK